jgi:hypothetical protein
MLKCKQLYVDTHCHAGAPHGMSAFHIFFSEWPYIGFLVFPSTLLPLLCSLVAWISSSALLSWPRKQLPSPFWQADVCLNFFNLFGKCVCIHCFDYSLVSSFTNETQVSSPVTRIMWLRNSLPSLWSRSKKSQSQSHSMHFVCTSEHFQNPSTAKLVIA